MEFIDSFQEPILNVWERVVHVNAPGNGNQERVLPSMLDPVKMLTVGSCDRTARKYIGYVC